VSDRKTTNKIVRQAGALWRMAASSLGTIREVAVRSTQAGYLRMDVALLHREWREELAALGAEVAALIKDGELQVPSHVRRIYDRIRELDVRIGAVSTKIHDNAFGAPRGYEPEAGNYEDDGDPVPVGGH
jgi:hypothetical protein